MSIKIHTGTDKVPPLSKFGNTRKPLYITTKLMLRSRWNWDHSRIEIGTTEIKKMYFYVCILYSEWEVRVASSHQKTNVNFQDWQIILVIMQFYWLWNCSFRMVNCEYCAQTNNTVQILINKGSLKVFCLSTLKLRIFRCVW